MAGSGIEIRGVAAVMKKLGAVEGVKVLERPMQRAVLRLQRRMAIYPPPPPRSRYIRGYGFRGGPRTSEKLGTRWTREVDVVRGGVQGRIGNTASYAPKVQSQRFQQPIFKRIGWTTDQQAIDLEKSAIIKDFERAIADVVK